MIGLSLVIVALASAVQGKNVTTKTYGNSTTHWTPCGQIANRTAECATIHVPMDHWAKQPSNKTFSVPLIRMLSNNSDAETILLNPGGPGGSGIEFLQGYGGALNKILDDRYHLLGFDPRGVGKSRPLARCEPDNARLDLPIKVALGPLVPSQDLTESVQANAGDYYAGQSNYARLCMETLREHLPFINTPQTAADMNDILHSIGQYKMNYYGTSYGTVLGTTYAQLYPDRVRRLAIDGVEDYSTYYNGLTYDDTQDADNIWQGLLSRCLEERATCALADGYSDVETLDMAIRRKIDSMDFDPVGVYINASAYGILRGADIRAQAVFMRLYSSSRWPYLARSLAYMMKGDYLTPYLHFFGGVTPKNPRKAVYSQLPTVVGADASDAQFLITVNDKSPKDQLTKPKRTRQEIQKDYKYLEGYFAKDLGLSEPFAFETWLLPRSHDIEAPSSIETAYPILVMSNLLDPVTPLASARVTSKILKNSVLLVQNAMGHCTVSKPSKCTAGHLRAYFNEGKMPEHGTVCQPDDPKYFPDPDIKVSKVEIHAHHDMDLDQALELPTEHSVELSEKHFKRF